MGVEVCVVKQCSVLFEGLGLMKFRADIGVTLQVSWKS